MYYLIIRAKNIGNHAVDAIINYTGPQGPEDLDVLAGQIVTKEIIFTTSTQPAAVEIKAFDKASNSLILINGRKSIFVNLTLTKVVTEIEISDSGRFYKRLFLNQLIAGFKNTGTCHSKQFAVAESLNAHFLNRFT